MGEESFFQPAPNREPEAKNERAQENSSRLEAAGAGLGEHAMSGATKRRIEMNDHKKSSNNMGIYVTQPAAQISVSTHAKRIFLAQILFLRAVLRIG